MSSKYKRWLFLTLALMTLALPAQARQFQQALPGYKFVFPRDHASHDEYRTEWWYFTGHLKEDDGKDYGYELTFFRSGQDRNEESKGTWNLQNIYLAHFAVTDNQRGKFFFDEKMNRMGPGFAGASQERPFVFNENWSMEQSGDRFRLKAASPEYSLNLQLSQSKPSVIHGVNGVSQKASCKGCASHYYSISRLETDGTITVGKQPFQVRGLTWMDHEFGSNQLTERQVGWDWYSIQLDNNYDLMLYVMRNSDGSIDTNSSGTIINPDGSSKHLSLKEFTIKSKSTWTSNKTKAVYPMGWHISIPEADAELDISPYLLDQELVTSGSTGVTYWEGASSVAGLWRNTKVTGRSYVEMTGYAERFRKRI